jgi:O-antigen/teichoic acid export membrane protein
MLDHADRSGIKNLTKKLPMVFAGKLMPVFFLLLITVIYSRELSYQDYGRYQTMWVLISLGGTLLLFGLPSIILSFPGSNMATAIRRHLRVILPAFILLLGLSMLLVWWAASDYNVEQRIYLCILLLLQAAAILTDTRLIKLNLLTTYIILNALYAVCFFCIHLVFIYRPFVLEELIIFLMALSCLKIVVGLLFARKALSPAVPAGDLSMQHWLYTGLNEVVGMAAKWLDKIVLLYLLTASEFAIYFNGSFEIPLFAVMVSAMENLMLTHISQDLNNKQAALSVFRESFKLLALIAFPVFCFFLFAHQEFYALVFQNKYDASIPVFVISLLLIPLRITHYGVILQCYGKGRQLLLGSVADLIISLLLMLVLYPLFNTAGIMLALVLSTYLQILYYLFESASILEVKIHQLVPFRYLGILLGSCLIIFYLLSLLRSYISSLPYLVMMLLAATVFIVPAVFRYFAKRKKLF